MTSTYRICSASGRQSGVVGRLIDGQRPLDCHGRSPRSRGRHVGVAAPTNNASVGRASPRPPQRAPSDGTAPWFGRRTPEMEGRRTPDRHGRPGVGQSPVPVVSASPELKSSSCFEIGQKKYCKIKINLTAISGRRMASRAAQPSRKGRKAALSSTATRKARATRSSSPSGPGGPGTAG